jgi:hypothetical protein
MLLPLLRPSLAFPLCVVLQLLRLLLARSLFHLTRCFLTHHRRFSDSCPAYRLMNSAVSCQYQLSARRIQLPLVHDGGDWSAKGGVVVKCVAVNTDLCNDAKRPASLVWRIRPYGAHGNTIPILSPDVCYTIYRYYSVGNT